MSVSSVGSLSSALSPAQTQETAGMLALKKANDIQAQSVLQLLQGVQPPSNNPPNLGNMIDVKA